MHGNDRWSDVCHLSTCFFPALLLLSRAASESQTSYLEKSVEARFLFLAPHNSLLAHFKKVDKRRVGLHQLLRLESEGDDDRSGANTNTRIASRNQTFVPTHIFEDDVSHTPLL